MISVPTNFQEVDGGFLHVDQDSTARFLGDLTVLNYKVSSVTEEGSDFAKDEWEGGCVWNNVWKIYNFIQNGCETMRCSDKAELRFSVFPTGAISLGIIQPNRTFSTRLVPR